MSFSLYSSVVFASTTIGTNISTAGSLTADGALKFTSGSAAHYILRTDALGNATWMSIADALMNAGIGIGEANGIAPLDESSLVPLSNLSVGVPGGLATLDGTGKITLAQLPAITINNTYVSTSTADMLALSANVGDIAIRTDENKTYVLAALPASTLSNWLEIITPLDTSLKKASNLSDLTDVSVAKTNLGLNNVTNDAQIPKSIGTAKGDLISFTASGLPVNLPVGDDGQFLMANASSSAGIKWTSSSASIAWGAITGILSDQTDLQAVLDSFLSTTTADATYPSFSYASTTYLTTATLDGYLSTTSAAASYLSIADATSTYPSFSYASSTYLTSAILDGYLSTTSASNIYISSSTADATYPSFSYASSTFLTSATLDGYVPYTGASTTLDLGSQNLTMTGTIDTTGVNFSTTTGTPSYLEGKIFYDTTSKSLTYYNDKSTVPVNIGQKNILRVENNSGGLISYGQVVYISGTGAGGVPAVALAKADDVATAKVLGFAAENIADGNQGYVTAYGLLTGINTVIFTAGDPIFLSDAVAGGITATPPTQPSYEVPVGYIGKSGAVDGTVLAFVVPKLTTRVDSGAVSFGGASGYLVSDSLNLFWDSINKRLGIGTNAPTYSLDVNGSIKAGNDSLVILGSKTSPDPLASTTVNGSMYYNSSLNKFRCFENSVWKDCDSVDILTLQTAYDNGATTTTALSKNFVYDLASGNFNVSGAGSMNLSPTGGINLNPFGVSSGNTGELRFSELVANGLNYIGFKAPDNISADTIWTLPATDGTSGDLLETNGSGVLSWTPPTALSFLPISSLLAASTSNSINNGDNAQTWNWSLANNNKSGLTLGENSASVGTGTSMLKLSTLTGSNARPLYLLNQGDADSFRIDTTPGDTAPFLINKNGNVAIGSDFFDPTNPEKLKVDSGDNNDFNIISAGGDLNNYLQINLQNRNAGDSASGDMVVTADNGNEDEGYVDMGINSSGYSNPDYDATGPNDAYLLNVAGPGDIGGNLAIGPASSGKILKFLTGGTTQADERMRIDGTGNVSIGTTTANARLDISSLDENALRVEPYGASAGNTGNLQLMELIANGSNYVGFKAPDNIGSSTVWTLPSSDGTSAQRLTTNGSGNLYWASAPADALTTRGDVLYHDATGTVRLPLGLSGQVLQSDGTDLAYATLTASSVGLGSVTNDAQIAKSIGTAKGDIIAFSASATPLNISVGTNGQILTASSTATSGLAWATPASGFADPLSTRGDIMYRDPTNTTMRLGLGLSGQVLQSDGTDLAYATLTASSVGLGSVENTALSTWPGTTNITTLGTVSTGTISSGASVNDAALSSNVTKQGNIFNGISQLLQLDGTGKIPAINGSLLTGLTSSQVSLGNVTNDAQIAKSIGLAKGDLISYSASNTPVRLPVGGTNGWVLQVDSSQTTGMKWAASSLVANSLDFTDFKDSMAVDNPTSINLAGKNLTINDQTGGGVLTLTSGAASTWQTSAGALTIDSAAGLNLGTGTSSAVSIGRSAGTFSLTSTGLNVTTGGALSGVTSIDTISASSTSLGFAGAGSLTAGGANPLTLTAGATSTWGTSLGNINLQANGSGTGNIQIGLGAGASTPDLLVLDIKNNTSGDPSGTNGALYYNSVSNKLRCYENSAWKDCDTAGASSLQTSYNNGATITTSGGNAITFTTPATSNNAGLVINQNNTANNPVALQISNTGTGNDITSTNWSVTKAGNLSTAGNLTTTGTGLITSAGTLTAQNGLTVSGGTIALTLGSDATGDIYYRNSSGNFTRLGIGSSNQILTVAGGLPSWATSIYLSTTTAAATYPTFTYASSTFAAGTGATNKLAIWTGANTISSLATGTAGTFLRASSTSATGFDWASVASPSGSKKFFASAAQAVHSPDGSSNNVDSWTLYDSTDKDQYNRIYGDADGQDLDITYELLLPSDFLSWNVISAITITYKTSSAVTTTSKVSCGVYDTAGTLAYTAPDAASTSKASITITSANLSSGTWTAGSPFMIICKGTVNTAATADVGKIVLDYNY